MNLLPYIDRSKKKCRFSNPLTGVVYNNNNYLKQCHYELDPQSKHHLPRRSSMHVPSGTLPQPHNTTKTSLQKLHPFHNSKTKYKASDSKINYTMNYSSSNNNDRNNNTTKVESKQLELSKLQKAIFKFPDIEVKIIDEIKSYKDYMEKNIRINLGHYFGMFFRKNLAGPLTVDLMQIVQKYLDILISKRSLDQPVEMKDYPSQYFALNSKRVFVQRIQQLETKKNFKPIEEMIKYYCVPTLEFRESCFRDIVHMLTQSLYQKFSLSKQKQYFILNQNGGLISQVCQFKFSTTQLLITTNPQHQKAYQQYHNIIKSNLQNFKKITFSEQLKRNFREKIASGKIQESRGNEHDQAAQAQAEGRRKFAQSKLEMHRNSDKSLERFSPSKTATNGFGNKSKQKANYNRQSKSSLSKPTSLNQIPTTNQRSLSGKKRDQAYMAAFQKLYFLNSTIDLSFNHYNQKKVLLKVMKTHSPLFKSKTQAQTAAILRAFNINPQIQSIEWPQFQKINEVSNCKGDSAHIVQFVCKYLPFNQYGELDKEALEGMVSFILNDEVGEDVVVGTIWSWLEKNNLITGNVLVRNNLQSWYERNKMAFVIVVSLVFGTNQTSWVDMAYQVLI